MRSRGRVQRAWVLGVATVVLAAGCSRQNPAFLGPADGGAPGQDANVTNDAHPLADAAPVPDGGCAPGSPCVLADNHCQIGVTVCAGDLGTCTNPLPAPDGTFCGVDKVCQDGSCVECAAGAACATGTECEAGRLDCSMASGAPVCQPTGAAPDGTACATGVCYDGACNSDVCGGLAGTGCDGGQVCDRNGCGADVVGVCITKPACPPPMPPYELVCGCDGTTYLDDCDRVVVGVALAHLGACASAREDCYNGVDDNGDGLVDCDDPACQATSTCVEEIPTGWAGIGWLDPDGKPACAADLAAEDLYESAALVAPTLECTCTCGSSSSHCAVDLACYGNDATCTNGTATLNATITGCAAVTMPGTTSGCKASEPYLKGACAAETHTVRPAVTWPATARACVRATGGYCTTTAQTCVPRAPAETIGPCIARAGGYACPTTGAYTVKRTFYTGQYTDSRTCTACDPCTVAGACTCEVAAPLCGVGLYSDAQCLASTAGGVPATNACTSITGSGANDTYAAIVGVKSPDTVGCVPGASTEAGAVALGAKVTICCAQ